MVNKERVDKVVELSQTRNDKHEAWLRHVLLSASGLLSIIIALHREKSPNDYTHYTFCLVIVLIGLGILSGSIYLYASISVLNQLIRDCIEDIFQDGKNGIEQLKSARPSLFYESMKWICYVSFSLAIPALVAYAIMLDR